MNLATIRNKIENGKRLSDEDALFLFNSPDTVAIGALADEYNRKKNGDTVFYNINRHINPTNICVYDCKFCAYSKRPGDEGAYAFSIDEIVKKTGEAVAEGADEIHMVGGLHPRWKFEHFQDILKAVKKAYPHIHIKGFTAVEIDWLARKARLSIRDTLVSLKEAGLDSMPGGGAEIFHQDVRDQITAKLTAEEWIDIHRTAHKLGMKSNCTMLYGHVESYAHRVGHMRYLRELQDETGGFNAFIPLSFQPHQNQMGIKRYTFGVDDLKTIAIARLYLDNFDHIKAYWIMLGQDIAQVATNFGANDLDGTVFEEKISRAAGGRSGMILSKNDIESIIHKGRKTAQQRNTVYETVGEAKTPKILTLPLPENFAENYRNFVAGKNFDENILKQVSKFAKIHDLMKDAGELSRGVSGFRATYGTSVRLVAKNHPNYASAVTAVNTLLESVDDLDTVIIDLSGFAKLDDVMGLDDLIKLVEYVVEKATPNNMAVASPKGIWRIARDYDLSYLEVCSKLKEANVTRIASSYLETETSLTHTEVKMLYSEAMEAGLKLTGKIELACPPSGLPLWDSFMDRLLTIREVAQSDLLDVINVEPAKETKLSPLEYMRAVAMTRLTLRSVVHISSPLQKIPHLSPAKGIGTTTDQHPQEKIAGICLLSGANDLGMMEHGKIDIASVVECIRSAGLTPMRRNVGYDFCKIDDRPELESLRHIPKLLENDASF